MRIRIVTEGASSSVADAPSVTPLLATRHLPRFTGEERGDLRASLRLATALRRCTAASPLEMTTLSSILASIEAPSPHPRNTGFPMFSLIVLTLSALKAARATA